ncbi:MAG: TRAP-type C4-dicarboxylate transport system, periplasmic component [Firmicutes bacterium]|nr:TRAP-type C4-dicarboxylate transport system, periplasmic component [Bacillota bacterium]MDI6707410.1 DctP family TRAP transporter solute-binding subunit [Bacillota bacterium]
MLKKSLVLMLAILMVVSLVAGCAQKGPSDGGGQPKEEVKPVILKMSVTTPEGSSWTKGAYKFAELVKERTNGKVEVNVYPNEQLSGGNQGKGIEMLMTGATDLSFHSNIIYSIMDERFGVISLPWLLPTYEKADEKIKGAGGEKVAELLLEKNVVALGFGENGFRQITNNKRPIATPDDMKGLKIRVPGIKMYISLYKALGADPTAMNFAEVFTSLQQGAIDGQENPLDVIHSAKLYEVQKYISLWNYSYDAIILGMNKDKFESFDKETQDILRQAAIEACEYQVELNRANGEDQLAFFKEQGMQVTEVTDEQIKAFQEKVKPVYDEYEPIVGKELLDLFR